MGTIRFKSNYSGVTPVQFGKKNILRSSETNVKVIKKVHRFRVVVASSENKIFISKNSDVLKNRLREPITYTYP